MQKHQQIADGVADVLHVIGGECVVEDCTLCALLVFAYCFPLDFIAGNLGYWVPYFELLLEEAFDSAAQERWPPFSHIFDSFALQKQLTRKAVQEALVKSLTNTNFIGGKFNDLFQMLGVGNFRLF